MIWDPGLAAGHRVPDGPRDRRGVKHPHGGRPHVGIVGSPGRRPQGEVVGAAATWAHRARLQAPQRCLEVLAGEFRRRTGNGRGSSRRVLIRSKPGCWRASERSCSPVGCSSTCVKKGHRGRRPSACNPAEAGVGMYIFSVFDSWDACPGLREGRGPDLGRRTVIAASRAQASLWPLACKPGRKTVEHRRLRFARKGAPTCCVRRAFSR